MRRIAFAGPLLALACLFSVGGLSAGCSSSSPPTLGGGAATTTYVDSEWESFAPELQIRLASFTGVCALRQAGSEKAGSSVLRISVTASASQTSIPPGTYMVSGNSVAGGATAAFNVRDATCSKDGPDSVGGTVTLTSALGVPGATATGSYDIQFSDGTTQSGSFSASFCDTSKPMTGASCVQ